MFGIVDESRRYIWMGLLLRFRFPRAETPSIFGLRTISAIRTHPLPTRFLGFF